MRVGSKHVHLRVVHFLHLDTQSLQLSLIVTCGEVVSVNCQRHSAQVMPVSSLDIDDGHPARSRVTSPCTDGMKSFSVSSGGVAENRSILLSRWMSLPSCQAT